MKNIAAERGDRDVFYVHHGNISASVRQDAETALRDCLRIDPQRLVYESRTATGRLYDAFELVREGGSKRLVEREAGRIAPRDCARPVSPKGREDRCWE